MPMLVRTPEQIFRAEKKDLYVIRSGEPEARNAPGLQMIQQWIAEHLPGTRMELLAPSEYSGFIMGGIGRDVRVDLSPAGLQTFCERWEQPDGASLDSRFQCFVCPYDEWYQQHGRFVPTRDKPQGLGITVWWYTPLGFIHHQQAPDDAGDNGQHPANPRDLWAHVPELWPELADVDCRTLMSGCIERTSEGGWWAERVVPEVITKGVAVFAAPEQVQDWFNLPPDVTVYYTRPDF